MYQGKRMLITGASSGIGMKIATYFANLGLNLILTYLMDLFKLLRKANIKVLEIPY